jgi:hypothetical protein
MCRVLPFAFCTACLFCFCFNNRHQLEYTKTKISLHNTSHIFCSLHAPLYSSHCSRTINQVAIRHGYLRLLVGVCVHALSSLMCACSLQQLGYLNPLLFKKMSSLTRTQPHRRRLLVPMHSHSIRGFRVVMVVVLYYLVADRDSLSTDREVI